MDFNFKASSEPAHPGRPIIWPDLKSKPTSTTEEETPEEATQTPKTPVSPVTTSSSVATASPSQIEQTIAQMTTSAAAEQATSTTFSLSPAEVAQLSQALQAASVRLTPENLELASLLEQLNLPISQETFLQLAQILSSTQVPEAAQAAALALAKGETSAVALRSLQQVLNGGASNPLATLAEQLSNLQAQLLANPLQSGSTSQVLVQLVAAYQEQLKKQWEKPVTSLQERASFFQTTRALSSILQGMLEAGALPIEQQQVFQQTLAALQLFQEQMLGELLMSHRTAYDYFQLPYPGGSEQGIDLLVQKDNNSEQASDEAALTQLIVRFETRNLDVLAVSMSVQQEKQEVSLCFHAESETVRQLVMKFEGNLRKAMQKRSIHVQSVSTKPQLPRLRILLSPQSLFNETSTQVKLEI